MQAGTTLLLSERTMTMNTNAFEKYESEVNGFFENAVGDMLQAYEVLYPEMELVK